MDPLIDNVSSQRSKGCFVCFQIPFEGTNASYDILTNGRAESKSAKYAAFANMTRGKRSPRRGKWIISYARSKDLGYLCHVLDSCPLSSDIFLWMQLNYLWSVLYIFTRSISISIYVSLIPLLSLDVRTPCLLPSILPHHCCFLYTWPDMRVRCSTARRWPDNLGLARGRRVLLSRRRPPSYS